MKSSKLSWIERTAENGGVDGMRIVLDAFGSRSKQGRDDALQRRLRGVIWAACCRSGSVSLLKWGEDALGLSREFMAPYLNDTCHSGSVEAVKWFVHEFDLSPDRLRTLRKETDFFEEEADWDKSLGGLLVRGCRSVPLVQWLLDWEGVDKEMIHEMKTISRLSLRQSGGPALVSLVERFSLNCAEACGSRQKVLMRRLCLADLETAAWLCHRFSLDLSGILHQHVETTILFHLIKQSTEALGKLLSLDFFPWDQLKGNFLESFFPAVCCLQDVSLARSITSACRVPKSCLHLDVCSSGGGIESVIDMISLESFSADGGETMTGPALKDAMDNVNVFKTLCSRGDTGMVRWLADAFSITKADLLSCEVGAHVQDRLVFSACASGKLDLVQWLAVRFSLTEEDFRSGGALHGAVQLESFPLVSWLVSSFVFTYGDIDVFLSSPLFLDIVQVMAGQQQRVRAARQSC